MVELMIGVSIVVLLAAIAIPASIRARRRSQACKVLNDLRLVDAAVDQYAVEYNKQGSSIAKVPDWQPYVKKGTQLYNTGQDIFGHDFGDQTVDLRPAVPMATYDALSDVVELGFWSPFGTPQGP